MQKHPEISVIIPTTRPKECARLVDKLKNQTFKNYEVIIETSIGPLSKIRNTAAKRANGKILLFTDDDISPTKEWLEEIRKTIRSNTMCAGSSGPACITSSYRKNRDIFRYRQLKKLYDYLFLRGKAHLPGHITHSGAWTTGACDESCNYNGEVHFLEACNMAFRNEIFWSVGGFDENYKGVGDYSEPDLAFRIRQKGWILLFNPKAKIYHEPSKSGAYGRRLGDAKNRLENYTRFSKKWIKPHWKHSLYKLFLKVYYGTQTIKYYSRNITRSNCKA